MIARFGVSRPSSRTATAASNIDALMRLRRDYSAPMNVDTAHTIAELINDRNKLTRKYTAEKVLEAAGNYICRFASDGRLVGVVEAKRVQWYQCEIDHLSVRADAEGKGVG